MDKGFRSYPENSFEFTYTVFLQVLATRSQFSVMTITWINKKSVLHAYIEQPESSDLRNRSMMASDGRSRPCSYVKKEHYENIINDQMLGAERTKFVN